ncbi:hypothetical protein NDU88_004488 [Pleurodeles waltl]|uniref:Uncharacterized protein n=1 Tax=Pleurodeles waltl TaxID=8319 RepID=A0AAV7QF06_PLEWA|nr:hypothetical protein NDU88_004488 [Pleurodeles waltl]
MDATRGSPGGTSSNVDGPGNTSGAGFVDPEETSGRRRREETQSTGGLIKSPGVHGEEVADAVTRVAEKEGRLRFLLSEAQQTRPLRRQQNAEASHTLGERGLTRYGKGGGREGNV